MLKILKLGLNDFLSTKILALVFVPLLVNVLFVCSVFYYLGISSSEYILAILPQSLQDVLTDATLSTFLKFLYTLGIYLALGICLLLCALIFNLFFSLFYTLLIVQFVHKKHFSHIKIECFGNIWADSKVFIKDLSIFILLFVICVPVYFIPLCASILPCIFGFLFFKKRILYDVGSYMMSKECFESFKKQNIKNNLYALVAYIPSLIPLLNLILMPLQILIITHYMFAYIQNNTESRSSH